MSGSWYIQRSGQLTGPLPFDELRALAGSGELTPDDEVRSGHGYWRPARHVDELWSDLTLTIAEDASVGSSAADVIGGLEWDEAATPLDEELWSHEPDHVEHRYLCRGAAEGHESGPFSLAELREQVAAGRLLAHDRVREEGSLCWIPCRELLGLEFPTVGTSDDSALAVGSQIANVADPDSTIQDGPAASGDPPTPVGTTFGGADEFDPIDVLNEEPVESSPPHDPVADRSDAPPVEASVEESASVGASTDRSELPTQSKMAPEATKTSPKTRSQGRGFRPGLSLPKSWTVYVLAGLLVVFAVLKIMPSHGGIYGEILVDEAPLPVGSMTIIPQGGNPREGVSIGVVDGRFESNDEQTLDPGSYDVQVTIGNHLGNAVPALDEAPALAALNGARLTTRIEVQPGDPIRVSLDSSEAVRLESDSGSVLNTE